MNALFLTVLFITTFSKLSLFSMDFNNEEELFPKKTLTINDQYESTNSRLRRYIMN